MKYFLQFKVPFISRRNLLFPQTQGISPFEPFKWINALVTQAVTFFTNYEVPVKS